MMKNDQFERKLQQQLDALPREIQAQRDLWPGIDLAIENLSSHAAQPGLRAGIAASIAVFGLIGLLFLNDIIIPDIKQIDAGQLISRMSEQHERQKQFLLTSYEQQPALTDNWQQQLQELDNAAAVIRTALEEGAGDAGLIKLLQQIYQQQIKLIQSVHQSRWL